MSNRECVTMPTVLSVRRVGMSILFKNAKIITTKNGNLKVLDNAFLGVDGKIINYIGTEKPRMDFDCEKDMYDKLLMPGLVNCHAHTAMNLLSGLGNDLPLMDWLHMLWPIEDRMRDEDFTSGMEMSVLEMLAGGTTSFSDMYWRPMITQKVIGQSGIKANITRVMMGGGPDVDYLTYQNRVEALEFFKDFNGDFDDRLHADWSVHAEYTIDERFAQRWAEEIQGLGGRLHIHLSETNSEHEECIAKKGKTPARWFYDLGFFNVPIRIHNRPADISFFAVFAVRNGNYYVIGSAQAVSDDYLAACSDSVESVQISAVHMLERMFSASGI